MATIEQKGPTEIQDFAKDVTTLYADDSKIDGSEIEQLKQKYVDEFFYSVGDDEIDTADEIAAVVRDINFDGIVDNSHNYSELKLDSGEKNKCYIGSPAYDRTVFSDAFIDMVRREIGSKPLEAATPREVRERELAVHKMELEYVTSFVTKVIDDITSAEGESVGYLGLTTDFERLAAHHKGEITSDNKDALIAIFSDPAHHKNSRRMAQVVLAEIVLEEDISNLLNIATSTETSLEARTAAVRVLGEFHGSPDDYTRVHTALLQLQASNQIKDPSFKSYLTESIEHLEKHVDK